MKHEAIVMGVIEGQPDAEVVAAYARSHPLLVDELVEKTAFTCMVCKCFNDAAFAEGVARLKSLVAAHPMLSRIALLLFRMEQGVEDELERAVAPQALRVRRDVVERFLVATGG